MSPRGVGGAVAAAAIGAVVGVALGIGIDRAWTERERAPVTDGACRDRVRAVEAPIASPPTLGPETAESPRRDSVAMEAKRDDAKVATDDELAELARLREQVRALEAEVARLEAIVAAKDPKTKRIREIFAMNDLRHGALYREIVELAASDPESVAEDPRRMCDLLIRLIDETGLLSAPYSDEHRDLAPEPEVPGIELSLYRSSHSERQVNDSIESTVSSEQASLSFSLELPKMPERWLGNPLSLRVHWCVEESSNNRGFMQLGIEDPTGQVLGASRGTISWDLNWGPDEVYASRSPIRGGDEHVEGSPRDLAAERRLVDDLFEKLRVRARG